VNQIGIGLIGCGRFGLHLAQNLGAVPGAVLVAVADPNNEAARAAAETFHVPSYSSTTVLLEDPRVQAVLVATPHATHETEVVAAARAGKHIFCEKPIAIDVDAAYRMMDAANAAGVKLMVGQVVRLYPLFRHVASIVREGVLGRIVACNFEGLYDITRVGWWAKSSTMGALLHSPGVHDIDFMRLICGEARNVFAREGAVQIQPGVDYKDVVHVSIEFASGAVGQLASSVSCSVPCRRGNVLGADGSLSFDARAGWIEYATTTRRAEHDTGQPVRIDLSHADDDEGVRAELGSFVGWVTQDEPPLVTAEDGLRAVEIIEAAYRSIRQHAPVALPLPRGNSAGLYE
jgi:predicted dehydrogenase